MRWIYLCILSASFSIAHAGFLGPMSPKKFGLAGAGRSGISQESLFTNPAAMSDLNSSMVFGYYTLPRITDWSAGGRQIVLGAYDGENKFLRAGFAFSRESRAILEAAGTRSYRDRTEYTLGVGRSISRFLDAGISGRYITRRDAGREEKLFDGDAGVIIKTFTDMRVGVTYENLGHASGEPPPVLGGGIKYAVLGPIAAYVDGGMVLRGAQKKRKQWSYAGELGLAQDVILRGGFFQDGLQGIRGRAVGLSWQGPRTSFDYGLRISRGAPVQREHVLGMSVQF